MLNTRPFFSVIAIVGAAICSPLISPVYAQTQLITNGDFENANLNGWQKANQSSSAGSFQVGDNTFTNLGFPVSPVEQYFNAGAASGRYYAVTDSLLPNTDAGSSMLLFQHIDLSGFTSFSSATLTFDMAVQDYSGAGPLNTAGALDYTQPDTQFVRVDLLRQGSLATDPFTLLGSDVLQNLFIGGSNTNTPSYDPYTFDITNLLNAQKGLGNQSLTLRFGVVGSGGFYHANVDNVSLLARGTAAGSSVVTPELPGVAQILPALLPLGFLAARKRRRSSVSKSH